jgi:uncharacterized iron-regulated membrane protein
MISFRKIFGQIHLWLGLVSGLVVFIVSLTGCLYVFEEEARDIFQQKYFYVENPAAARRHLDDISAAVQRAYPEETITQIRFKEAADAAFVYHTKSKKAISINPYTLQIQGVRDLETDFFNFILDIHLNLKLGEIGEHIIKWNVLIFFVLCVSGFVLWLPKQKKFLKQALTIKWNAKSWKRLNWDLHSVLGFYALAVLLIISLTGIFWMYDSAKWLVSKAVGEEITTTAPPASRAGASLLKSPSGGLGAFYHHARHRHPGAAQTFITFPQKPDEPLRVLFRYPYSVVRKQNTLFYDASTSALLREDLYKNYNAYDKVMRSNYDFHTGRIRILGLGSKILYFLASLFAASLPVTGTLIWWSKRKKKATHLTRQSYANY